MAEYDAETGLLTSDKGAGPDTPNVLAHPELLYPGSPEVRQTLRLHLARSQRRAMHRMAEALSIDHSKFAPSPEGLAQLWQAIVKAIGQDGIRTSPANTPPDLADPYGVALECICKGREEGGLGEPARAHGGRGWWRQTAIVKTGAMVDQAEGERIIAFLKGQERVVTCDATLPNGEACGAEITTFSVHNGRISEMAMRDGYAMEWAG